MFWQVIIATINNDLINMITCPFFVQLQQESFINVWLTGTRYRPRLEPLTSEVDVKGEVWGHLARYAIVHVNVLEKSFSCLDIEVEISSTRIYVCWNQGSNRK